MPTYINTTNRDIMVGDTLVKKREKLEINRYLAKNELNKNIKFISDDPPVSPIINSFVSTIDDTFEIELDITKYKALFDLYINTTGALVLYFNSVNSYPAYLKEGQHCFSKLRQDMVRKIIFVNQSESSINVDGFMIV
jgi:hypothetical protein